MLKDENIERYIVEAIKPLQKQIKELKAEVKKLKADVGQMNRRNRPLTCR